MSKAIKIALILAIGAVAIAARQLTTSDVQNAAASSAGSVSPHDIMRKSGPLPPTKVDSYY